MNKDAETLANLIRSVTKRSLSGTKNIGLMFSGGLDSAVLAVTARKHCDITLYIAGMEGSHDLEWGCECASILDIPHVSIIFQEKDIIQAMQNVVKIHGMTNPKWMSTFVGFDLILQKVGEKHVICGQGADELFGGYRKYGRMADAVSAMNEGVMELVSMEIPAYKKMAAHYEKTLLAPYLDDELIYFAGSVPEFRKFNESDCKIILRDAADIMGVPGMMAHRQKKAMQYGTNISKTIKKHLKNSGINLESFIKME
jgi:asparagine synthase (glutamine-hydrolysing)